MKTRKIRNIEKSVCTAEQKIAYNIAFRAHISYGDNYKKLPTAAAKSDAKANIIDCMLKQFRRGCDYKPGQFNEDAIFAALNAGLAAYLENPFIASDYARIGNAFPINY